MLLHVEAINSYYGKSHILHDVSLDIGKGESVALLGRNGAGKTTTMCSIIGLMTPKSGKVVFDGKIWWGKDGRYCPYGIHCPIQRIFS